MKVGNSPDLAKAQAAATRQAAKAGASAPAETTARGSAAADGAPVTLSPGVQAAALERAGADFNAGKVAAVKAAIDDGSFQVNAEAVADKLLDNAYETLSHVARQRSH